MGSKHHVWLVALLVVSAAPLTGCLGNEDEQAEPASEDDVETGEDAGDSQNPSDGSEADEEAPETSWESDEVSGEVLGAAGSNLLGTEENGKHFEVPDNATQAIFNVTLQGQGEITVFLLEPGNEPCADHDEDADTSEQEATLTVQDPPSGTWSICVYAQTTGAAHGTWTLTADSKVVE